VVHCAVVAVLGAAGLDAATEVVFPVAVWEVPVLEADAEVVLLVAVLGAPIEVVLLEVVLDARVFAVVAEVLLPAEVLDVLALAVVAEVFCGVVAGAAGVCGDSVCAKRIAAETKLQTSMMIERFMVHPFEDIESGKVSRPWSQFKNSARSRGISRAMKL
jgi:hypothetical protein